MTSLLSPLSAMLLGIVLIAALPAHGQDTASEVCAGPYKGKKLSPEELNKVLEAHTKWLDKLIEKPVLRAMYRIVAIAERLAV